MFRMHKRAFAALLLLCLASAAFAQNQTPANAPPPPPPLNIPRTEAPVNMDGALDDAAWQTAAVIDKFYETSPGDNIPAKIATTAYVTYDAKYFYIGIKADDPDPSKIRAPFVDRDGVIGTDDNIAIFLDTRNDKRSAIELRVNPRGIQADGIFNDANSNEDFSPDFYYDTAAQITSTGWTAEFRIPFSQLRYADRAEHTFGLMIVLIGIVSFDRLQVREYPSIDEPVVTAIPNVNLPLSRGEITIAGPDIRLPPIIKPRLLDHPRDVEVLRRGGRILREIFNTPPLLKHVLAELAPGPDVETDDEWESYLRSESVTIFHPCGTCKMGVDDTAVVEPDLRVRGMESLCVADASVMPHLVSGNINAPVIMIAGTPARTTASLRSRSRPSCSPSW